MLIITSYLVSQTSPNRYSAGRTCFGNALGDRVPSESDLLSATPRIVSVLKT